LDKLEDSRFSRSSDSMNEPPEAPSVVGVCSIALSAVAATAGVEAIRATVACVLAHAGARTTAIGAFEAFGTVALPLALVGLLGGALLGRAEVRKSVSAWSSAMVGDATQAPIVVVGLPLTVFGLAVGAAATVGNRVGATASTRVAVSVTIVTTLATLLGATLVATWLVARLAPLFGRISARSRVARLTSTGGVAALVCVVIATLTLSALVPFSMLSTARPNTPRSSLRGEALSGRDGAVAGVGFRCARAARPRAAAPPPRHPLPRADRRTDRARRA
jgi:hypothetical protein